MHSPSVKPNRTSSGTSSPPSYSVSDSPISICANATRSTTPTSRKAWSYSRWDLAFTFGDNALSTALRHRGRCTPHFRTPQRTRRHPRTRVSSCSCRVRPGRWNAFHASPHLLGRRRLQCPRLPGRRNRLLAPPHGVRLHPHRLDPRLTQTALARPIHPAPRSPGSTSASRRPTSPS